MRITNHQVQYKAFRQPSYLEKFRLRPIAAVIASMAMMSSGLAYADEPTVAELKAEIARLKQIIASQSAEVKKDSASNDDKKLVAKGSEVKKEDPETLGEVTVRGGNRLERLQDVPVSVSVVTGNELDRLGATDISAITQRAANVTWNPGNQRTSSLSIRGIGKIGQTEAQDPSVGISVDGVNYAYNPLSSSYDFTDVDSVQVARGPQGALLGKNTSLGLISVTTNRPSFTPSTEYSLTIGQRDTVIGRYATGGPIVDDLIAWRGAFSVSKGAGNILNLYNNTTTYTNTDRLSGRVQFLLTPNQDFSARFSLNAQPRSGEATNNATINTPTPAVFSNGSANGLGTDASVRLNRSWFTREGNYSYLGTFLYGAGLNAVDLNAQQALQTGSNGASAELTWKLGKHTLTSITAYQSYYFDAVNDEGTPFDINGNSGGFENYFRQLSQEFRIASQPGGVVDYQAGVYFLKTSNNDYYNKQWGSDAGAFYASNAQYKVLNATPAGQLLMQNALDRLTMLYSSPAGIQNIENKSASIFGQADWHYSDRLTITAGARATYERRENEGSSSITDNGFGASLNPVSVNGVALGGFATNSSGALVAGNTADQLALADSLAKSYFGANVTNVPGAAYASLTAAQQLQVANAKALRAAQIGVLFNKSKAEAYKGTSPTAILSPSYRINDQVTTYVSWQYGEKAGVSQFTNGISNPVKPEKTSTYEWGIKTSFPEQKLTLNADIFWLNIKDYQQAVRVLDAYTTALNNDGSNYYTTATGNVPKVQAKGLEIDAVYGGIRNTTIRFAGAYNDARYKSFPNSAQPVENGYAGAPPYQDVSGQALPGAAKFTFNLGVDYRQPIINDKEFHFSFNTAYTSKFNSDTSLSQYAWIPSHSVTDFAIGVGTAKQTFDVSLLAKNLFNDKTPQTLSWNSYTPPNPRWLGVMFSGKL